MSAAEPFILTRQPLPDMIERGRLNLLTCPVTPTTTDAAATVTAATVQVLDADGAEILAPTAANSLSPPSYAWTPAATLALGERWQVIWSLSVGSAVHVVRRDAALVRVRLHCPITADDVYRVAPEWDPNGTSPATAETTISPWITEAWVQVQAELISRGNRPNLIIGAAELRECTLYLTLALRNEAAAARLSPAYIEQADRYRRMVSQAWNRIRLVYADADDAATSTDRRRGMPGTLWLSGHGGRRFGGLW